MKFELKEIPQLTGRRCKIYSVLIDGDEKTLFQQFKEYLKMDVIDEILAQITPEQWTLTDRKMGVASLIADAIKAKGLSHGEFAQKIGKKTADIPLMLSGNYDYTIGELTQIEYILDTKLFFSSELDWWNPEPIKPTYAAHTIELSMAAEP